MLSSRSLIIVLIALGLIEISQSQCSSDAQSDICSKSPNVSRHSNVYQYQYTSCDLKWDKCTVKGRQKPAPYALCTTMKAPSGRVKTDAYTLAMQVNNVPSPQFKYSLHGLWASSQFGKDAVDQPYGCENGQAFNENFLVSFGALFDAYWPTDPSTGNTEECFILSEWMKHGTCAVIPGRDGNSYRITQEDYYRTAIVFANEYNVNPTFQATMGPPAFTPISVDCVQCAYFAASTWHDYTVASVPRMPTYCIDQCILCTSSSECPPANLDSTVLENPFNAPIPPPSLLRASLLDTFTSDMEIAAITAAASAGGSVVTSFAAAAAAALAVGKLTHNVLDHRLGLEGGVWRSWGAETNGSGKFEFTQTFNGGKFTSTTDSPFPNQCSYRTYIAPSSAEPERVLLYNCGADKHTEDCLVKRLSDIGGLEVAFFACNHSGIPAPLTFHEAMDTKNLGNFLMFRCKQSSEAHHCHFNPITSAPSATTTAAATAGVCTSKPSIHAYQPGVGGAPNALLGSWRTLEVQQNYEVGLVRWNFTSDGQATAEFRNSPNRDVQRYAVTHSVDGSKVYLAGASGIKSCLFHFQYNAVYSYALLACGPDNQHAPTSFEEAFEAPNSQWAMGRCNGCSGDCFYSCGPQNNNCGHGSCAPPDTKAKPAATASDSNAKFGQWNPPNWCGIGEKGCWPTMADILTLEQQLGPNEPRTGLHWTADPQQKQPQTAPVPPGSAGNFSFYGLGQGTSLRALYHYDKLEDIHQSCFPSGVNSSTYQNASDICKASVRGNEYRNWNPFLVVFPLNERHVRAALQFAVKHRLCIATSGTGHEYNSRQVCPAGGILIRTILLKDKAFLPVWEEDPSVAPHGAFRFGSGIIFTELHAYSAGFNRLVSSGWCSTVGIPGWHLGGGHGPFAPSLGLGVDNALEFEILQIRYDQTSGQSVIQKVYASRHKNPQLFWAMRGGGGGVWGVILSITTRAHLLPAGGLTNVQFTVNGNFAQNNDKYSYEWLRGFWQRFANWNLILNQKVSTQPGFFPNITNAFAQSKDLKDVTWSFSMEYFYAGGKNEPEYKLFRDRLLHEVFEVTQITPSLKLKEITYPNAYAYVLSMPPDKFLLNVNNPLPPPHVPSLQATGSQNSVFVSREAMRTGFARTMMSVLDICVATLYKSDPIAPTKDGSRCGFHYLYTSITGNLGSSQPRDTAIAPGFRSGLMLWNARTLSIAQADATLYTLGPNSYFSESSYVLPDWVHHYWGESRYAQLLAVKQTHDPGNHFWCHHCVGDNPEDADAAVYDTLMAQQLPKKGNLLGHGASAAPTAVAIGGLAVGSVIDFDTLGAVVRLTECPSLGGQTSRVCVAPVVQWDM